MKLGLFIGRAGLCAILSFAAMSLVRAQFPGEPGGFPPFDGPPQGPGGFGGMRQERKIVSQFDKNGDSWLNAEERKAAREFLAKEPAAGGNRQRGPRGPGRMQPTEPKQPGPKVSPADVKSFPGKPLYSSNVLRTVFLDFENADWEKELSDFHGTDVDVPAKLTLDGKTYTDVGVHFRGASSYMMVPEGSKRSLNVSVDFVHDHQAVLGYRTLNLMNSHEDPTFLRSVLFYDVARSYLPAPKANFVRVVINGESWGVYVNVEQFNKDFVKEWFATPKGARWKVPGGPNGKGSLAYLGEDVAQYKRIYEIKSKDDPKSWTSLIKLCKVLNETPSNQLEKALAPLLDIDGALKFLALDNALINNDGYWIRTSDYSIYQGTNGQFHVFPWDANETFSKPGGPGFGGGPGGFGPGGMIARQMLEQGDGNSDRKLTRGEFTQLADGWFNKLAPGQGGRVTQEELASHVSELLPPPEGFGPPGGGPGGEPPRDRGGFGPGRFIATPFFAALDSNRDGALTRDEMKSTFENWFAKWDAQKTGFLTEDQLRTGFSEVLPAPNFGGRRNGPNRGGGRGPGGPGGPGGGIRVNGVELDPLVDASDLNKPLISKLLAVPALRQRYLGYVLEIAEKWLAWERLGPMAQGYQSLIATEVKADTRKLNSTEDFNRGLLEDIPGNGFGPGGRGTIGLKNFADQRRAYLLRVTAPTASASTR